MSPDPERRSSTPDVSVVLCTWNRAALLERALAALTAQRTPPRYEIIVVDNASADDTCAVVARAARSHPQVRYLRESRQGLSFARNAGIAASRAPIVAFTDDDIRVSDRWLRAVADAFDRHPGAACVGGPVTPRWPARVPRWLTQRHWSPLGVQDYGPVPLQIDVSRSLCLIGANLAVRRTAIDLAGGFDPSVQRVCNGVGSTEDHEWQRRLWSHGAFGIYEPSVHAAGIVGPERVSKRHHRAWRFGHGRHVARMHMAEVEEARWRLFGVPAHILRQALVDVHGWIAGVLQRDEIRTFDCEARLCFAAGFILERLT